MRRVLILLLPALMISGLVLGCGHKSKPRTGIPGLNSGNYPRVSGSTSTIPLGQLMVSRALKLKGELRRSPAPYESAVGVVFPVNTSSERMEEYRQCSYRASHMGTHQAYIGLADGKPAPTRRDVPLDFRGVALYRGYGGVTMNKPCDIILVARKPSKQEYDFAYKRHVEFDCRPIALDAFVFLVNRANPVRKLTTRMPSTAPVRRTSCSNGLWSRDRTESAAMRS